MRALTLLLAISASVAAPGRLSISLTPVLLPFKRGPATLLSGQSLSALFANVSKPLENRMNFQYKGTLQLGTPPRSFELIFDTGSSWLWVTNTTCGESCHSVSSAFEASASQSYQHVGTDVTLEYGMGTAIGFVGNDSVAVVPGVAVEGQTFVTVYRNSGFQGMQADGILGMGFNTLAEGHLTLVENLYTQRLIEKKVFSIFLSDNDFGAKMEASPGSTVTLGYWDLKQFANSESFVYLPVYSSTGYWALPLKSVRLGEVLISSQSFTAILDSGTSFLVGPAGEVMKIWEHFVNTLKCSLPSNLLECECNDLSTLPNLEFYLGAAGYVFVLTPEMYMMQRNGNCVLLLESTQDSGLWILGDVFLRAYYTVFDMSNSVVGLAPSISNKQEAAIYKPPAEVIFLISLVLMVVAVVVVLVLAFLGFSKCCSPEAETHLSQRLITT